MSNTAHQRESQPAWAAWIEISPDARLQRPEYLSQPAWAAWIEIDTSTSNADLQLSQPAWAAWIEIVGVATSDKLGSESQPAWAAWIEIAGDGSGIFYFYVAARMGCVD